jgi:hypothetical protein
MAGLSRLVREQRRRPGSRHASQADLSAPGGVQTARSRSAGSTSIGTSR